MNCYHAVSVEDHLEQFLADSNVPRCPRCDGILKPNATLFGEALPAQAMLVALQAVRTCDVMLVAGSSLEVAPASSLPELAQEHQAKLIIINLGETHLDRWADVLIRGDVADVLPRLAGYLGL